MWGWCGEKREGYDSQRQDQGPSRVGVFIWTYFPLDHVYPDYFIEGCMSRMPPFLHTGFEGGV